MNSATECFNSFLSPKYLFFLYMYTQFASENPHNAAYNLKMALVTIAILDSTE